MNQKSEIVTVTVTVTVQSGIERRVQDSDLDTDEPLSV